VAVAIFTAILKNVLTTQTLHLVPAAAIAAGLPESSIKALGILAAFFTQDIEHLMTDKTEVFLENDVHAEMNRFH
jgi:hypothetical protein